MSMMHQKWLLKDAQSLEGDGANLRVKLDVDGGVERSTNGLRVAASGITNAMLAGSIAESKLADTFIRADGANTFAADQSMGGFKLTNVAVPTVSTDAANKGYVDAALAGLDWQPDVMGVQTDATLVPVATADQRYIITDAANLNAAFGTITGVENNDIVQYDGAAWVVAYDVSVQGEGALTWNRDADRFEYFNQTWSEFGGLSGVTPGIALSKAGNTINVNLDNVTVEVDGSNNIRLKDAGISTAKIADDAVTAAKLNADVAGLGLIQALDGSLDVNTDNSTLEIDSDVVRVKAAGITKTHISTDIAGAGLTGGAGSALSIVAGNGIAVSTDVGLTALSASWDVGGTYTITNLPAPVNNSDAVTKLYVDNAVAGLNSRMVQRFVLTATDITNKFVTLSAVPAVISAVQMEVRGGPNQFYGEDYTVDGTNQDRVTWASLALESILEDGDRVAVIFDA